MKARKWIPDKAILCAAMQNDIKLRLQLVSVILMLFNIWEPVLHVAFFIWRGVCWRKEFKVLWKAIFNSKAIFKILWKANKILSAIPLCGIILPAWRGHWQDPEFVCRESKTRLSPSAWISFQREHEKKSGSKRDRYFLDADKWQISATQSWWSQITCAHLKVFLCLFFSLSWHLHDLFLLYSL